MVKVEEKEQLDKAFLENIGQEWLVTDYMEDYLQPDTLAIEPYEAIDFNDAANELYDMFEIAGEYVIQNDLFRELGINQNLVEAIKHTWENDNHWHIYGRYDFAGGIDGKPIKLLEFNADTATSIPECAIIQWAHLLKNEMDPDSQYNELYECFINQFKMLIEQNPDKVPTILFTYMDDDEDWKNVELISSAAKEAGFEIEFAELPDIHFSNDKNEGGVWLDYGDEYIKFDFWFKLIPWEFLSEEEPELLKILTDIMVNEQCVIMNPPYSLLYQSKGILKILWDLYPNHPLLLESSFSPLENKPYVSKSILGREGANIKIVDGEGNTVAENDGDYAKYKKVYQEYAELATDKEGRSYQAGVFFAGEGAGLVFRRGPKIIDDSSQLVPHYIKK